ncbi:MAG: hypothetical protein ACI9OJ_000459 [Myxococcota bacterium]|jgi:hypothetical protein
MGKNNRNAPCPCGSAKKYKKCCLDVPSSHDATAGAAESDMQASDLQVTRFLDAVDYCSEHERRYAQTRNRVATQLHDALQLSLAARHDHDVAAGLDWLMRVDNPLLVEGQAETADRFRSVCPRWGAPLLDQWRAGTFDLWSFEEVPQGVAALPTFSPPHVYPLHHHVSVHEQTGAGYALGWMFTLEGHNVLLTIAETDELDSLETYVDSRDGSVSWTEVVADVLTPDPVDDDWGHGRYGVTPALESSIRASRLAALFELTRANMLYSWETVQPKQPRSCRPTTLWMQTQVALCDTDKARQAAKQHLEYIRTGAATGQYQYYWKSVALTEDEIAAACPLDTLLGNVGLTEDVIPVGFDSAALERLPLGLLLLEDDHPAYGALSPAATIAEAVAWAEPSKSPRAAEVLEALRVFRAERRWSVLIEHGPAVYEPAVEALHRCFSPKLMAQPIASLKLKRGIATRLDHALEWCIDRRGPCYLADLPETRDTLLAAPGFGPGTFQRLQNALLPLMQTWRYQLTGIAQQQIEVAPDAEAQTLIGEGLDELAALFDI